MNSYDTNAVGSLHGNLEKASFIEQNLGSTFNSALLYSVVSSLAILVLVSYTRSSSYLFNPFSFLVPFVLPYPLLILWLYVIMIYGGRRKVGEIVVQAKLLDKPITDDKLTKLVEIYLKSRKQYSTFLIALGLTWGLVLPVILILQGLFY